MVQELTFDEAVKLINFNNDLDLCDAIRHTLKGKYIPCFFEGHQIRELLRDWKATVQVAGPLARKKGYGVVLCDDYGYLYIHTIAEEMGKLKIIDNPHQYPVN